MCSDERARAVEIPEDDRETVRSAAVELVDLSHTPLKAWGDDDRERVQDALDTLTDAEILSTVETRPLKAPFDRWTQADFSEGKQATAVHDLRETVLDALPESLVSELVARGPDERNVTTSSLRSDANTLAHSCRMPAEVWDATDREQAAHYLASLREADLYADHAAGLQDRLADWPEEGRDSLVDDLREFAIEATEVAEAREDEQAGGWREEYETTTYRGPDRYPVPEDWELRMVESDGIQWTRPERPENPGLDWEPEDEALTLNEWNSNADERTVSFDVNGDMVFTVTEPDRGDLMSAIGEVLRRVARGEQYHDVAAPDEYGMVEDDSEGSSADQNASLGEFGADMEGNDVE